MPLQLSLEQIALHLNATLQGGEPASLIRGVAGIETAVHGQLTFVSNPRYAPLARSTQASAVLVEPAFPEISAPTLRTANPYLAFAQAVELFYQAPAYPPGIHPTAVVAASATIGPGAHVGPYVVVMDHACIGEHAVLLRSRCHLPSRPHR